MNHPPFFTAQTFAWLEAIARTPTAAFYLANKAAFQQHVEHPLRALFQASAARLPALMLDRLETRRNVFSRVLKNDFGNGGAWANYWGALYPKGSRRLADVQLAIWMNRERLHVSFYIGDYAAQPRRRFLANLAQFRPLLPGLLADLTGNPRIRLARQGRTELDESGRLVPAQPMTWGEWLDDPAAGDWWAFLPLTPVEVMTLPGESLSALAAETHAALFPLALLAMLDDPLPVIEAYLGC